MAEAAVLPRDPVPEHQAVEHAGLARARLSNFFNSCLVAGVRVARGEDVGRERQPLAVGRPGDAGGLGREARELPGLAGRAGRAHVDHPDLRPAVARRDERQPLAVGRPAGRVVADLLGPERSATGSAARDGHHPQVVVPRVLLEADVGHHVSHVPAVGRQVRVGHPPELQHLLDGEARPGRRLRKRGRLPEQQQQDGRHRPSRSKHDSSRQASHPAGWKPVLLTVGQYTPAPRLA